MAVCKHDCYTDWETGDLWCPAYGGWQAGGCPLERGANDDGDDDNERNDDDEGIE